MGANQSTTLSKSIEINPYVHKFSHTQLKLRVLHTKSISVALKGDKANSLRNNHKFIGINERTQPKNDYY